ncbi:MerR family transcriptional regulator [Paenibacillus oryzisoli]|uniref:Transcriptional regulator n=1 Tax=Paenibacillus oryzisoli TaxID=1850517 RepID=A0A198ABP2_9BACL|nr:MerR family transcriptional regulator [Paenibacillus oryzisoli]OAS18388.1 transcriptional regulator [Paenibacillus oryzisoli]
MQIKDVARKLKISPRAIRFYEDKGLISPSKQETNSYRTFTEEEIWRLQTIISLRESGMSVADIQKALQETDADNKAQLQYYLEIQRSVVYAQWLEFKHIIETTDTMINLLKQNNSVPIDDIFTLAEGSKRLREIRKNWKDTWNFDQQALTHDERVLHNDDEYKGYEEILDLTWQWVKPRVGEKGLDLGTGTGNLAHRFLQNGIHMAGVDQSKEMMKQCQSKHPQMDIKLGNFLAIPYMDNQFDFIVTSFAFHHISNEQQPLALDEMRRVLKSHGRICIADIMFETESAQEQYMNDLLASGRTDLLTTMQEKHYAICPVLLSWFEENGYITKHAKINDLLYIVYAVPIKPL